MRTNLIPKTRVAVPSPALLSPLSAESASWQGYRTLALVAPHAVTDDGASLPFAALSFATAGAAVPTMAQSVKQAATRNDVVTPFRNRSGAPPG